MIQIALLIFAGVLLVQGVRALAGKEAPEKKTGTPVAVATIVCALALAGFAIFGLPLLLDF
jgi:hypothetical protein